MEQTLSPSQVAELIGTAPGVVSDWMQKGVLPFLRLPDGRVRISRTVLLDVLEKRGVDIGRILPAMARLCASPHAPAEAAIPTAAGPADADATDERLSGDAPAGDEVRAIAEAADAPPAHEAPPAPQGPAPFPQAAVSADAEPAAPEAEPPPPPAEAEGTDEAHLPPASAEPQAAARQILHEMLRDALARGADALHLEHTPAGLTLAYRLGDRLHPRPHFAARLPAGLADCIVQVLCELADVSGWSGLSARGRFELELDGRGVWVELSCLRGGVWQRLVLVPSAPRGAGDAAAIELDADRWEALDSLLGPGWGVVLVAGGPGFARMSLLGALAARAQRRGGSRVHLQAGRLAAGIDGLHVRLDWTAPPAPGELTAGLCDVDLLSVDDVRDLGGLGALVETALDGSLVLAGVSVADAAEAVGLIGRLGLPPFATQLALRGACGVGRVAELCVECREPRRLRGVEAAALGAPELAGRTVFEAEGCPRCGGRGSAGSAWLVSVLGAAGVAGALDAAPEVLGQRARLAGFESLAAQAVGAMLDGRLSPREAMRTAGGAAALGVSS